MGSRVPHLPPQASPRTGRSSRQLRKLRYQVFFTPGLVVAPQPRSHAGICTIVAVAVERSPANNALGGRHEVKRGPSVTRPEKPHSWCVSAYLYAFRVESEWRSTQHKYSYVSTCMEVETVVRVPAKRLARCHLGVRDRLASLWSPAVECAPQFYIEILREDRFLSCRLRQPSIE